MKGTFSFISGVRYVEISTSRGSTDDFAGTRRISSNVNPSTIFILSLIINLFF